VYSGRVREIRVGMLVCDELLLCHCMYFVGRECYVCGVGVYCDRFDSTSDMGAATQRIRRPSLGNDSVNHA
jgi:hypothetical protein